MSLYKVSERREALLSIYQYLLTVSTGREISGPDWKRTLADALADDPRPHGIRQNSMLPEIMDNFGSVDAISGLFEVTPRSRGPIGVWFSSIGDSWHEIKPEERCYDPRDWEVEDLPGMVVYVWSERSQIKNRTKNARLADFGNWDRLMQVRVVEWLESDSPNNNKYPRRILNGRDAVLTDVALRRDMMHYSASDLLKDVTLASYQERFDDRLRDVLDAIESDKRVRARIILHEP